MKLECTVRMAKPAASIVWYRGNVQIKGGDISVTPVPIADDKDILKAPDHKDGKLEKYDTHGSIFITSTPDDDEMSYTCEAKHPAIPIEKPMRATAVLSVFYAPGPPYIEGYAEGETLRRGQQVELTCKSRGGNPPAQVVWYRNGEVVHSVYTTEGRISKNVHSFIATASDDKARFECKVSNVMSVTPMITHVDLSVLFSPNKVDLSGPTEAKAEEQVTITCTTDISNPVSEIKWVVDNHKINSTSQVIPASEGGFITTSNITFTINKMAQRAVVVCHAFNFKLSETIVGTHTINVIYPPSRLEMAGYEQGAPIVAGTVLKLSCTAISGNPLATITWYKNDNKVSSHARPRDHAVTSEMIHLVNASDNKAVIRCEASNSATQIPLVQSVHLNVHFLPEQVKISTEPKTFRAGEKGRLICESTSSNPPAEMSWWKSGSPVRGTTNSTKEGLYGGYISTVELGLELSETMNNEEFTCQAKNPEIDRSIHDSTMLNILYKPVFEKIAAGDLVGLEGEPFVVSLSAHANPSAITYIWSRDGLPLSNGAAGARIAARGSTLNITRLERNDAGTYNCEAMNEEGSTFFELNLTVQYPVTLIRTSTSGVVYPAGNEAKLFCEVEGSPLGAEYVSWYKDGTNVAELGGHYITYFANKTSFLRIRRPTERDVGEYKCNINNGINNVTSEPILFITNFKPEMANSHLTKKAAVNSGASAQLYCKARGSPLPQFTWVFNGKPILSNMTDYKYKLTYMNLSELYSQSILTVQHVSQSDYGKYECQAHNNMGHATELIGLDVTSPPDEPTDLEVVNVTHDSVTLTWKRGFDGGLPTSHQIRWRETNDEYDVNYRYLDVSPGNYTAVVKHLALGTSYVFSVRAKNSKGESPFLPDLVKAQTLRPESAENHPPDVLRERGENPMKYVYTIAATSIVFFIINVFIMLWYIVRKKNKDRINKSQTADMYAPSTVNGDTMTGELSSVSDEKSDVNFDANDYVDEGRKTAASTYLIDPTLPDYGKSGLEMQVHQQTGTLNRRSNHIPSILSMDSPPQRTTASGTLSASKSSYIGNPSPAPPADVNFYSVEMESGRFMGYEGTPSPAPTSTILEVAGPGAYYPSLSPSSGLMHPHPGAPTSSAHPHQHQQQAPQHHTSSQQLVMGVGTLTRTRTLPRPVPPPDVTVMTAGTKSPLPPTVPPPPATFARAAPGPAHSHGHPLSTFTSTPQYSDIDGHLV
ncbi:nephrin isoform X2 [Phymastichus coffea]|uniref:nephrin isoform X2 n=1 Tax=Phymastichus coffea TaxID=108790 RepID=UPI00273B46F4|nr:nephrin isoform X2 [Phymastichus coffea]